MTTPVSWTELIDAVRATLVPRWAIRHAHGMWVDFKGDIYLGLTIDHSVDKWVRQR